MEINKFSLFKAIYCVLDELWKNSEPEELRIYLSDANPILFENGTSLDPAVFEEFSRIIEERQDVNDKYELAIYYLDHLDPYYGDIKKYFLNVSKNRFIEKLDEFSKL